MVDNQQTHGEITTSNDPETSCRRSTREKRSSTCYSPNEYILLNDIGELEGYDELMIDTHRYKCKELTVDNHEFCKSVAGRKPFKSYFT